VQTQTRLHFGACGTSRIDHEQRVLVEILVVLVGEPYAPATSCLRYQPRLHCAVFVAKGGLLIDGQPACSLAQRPYLPLSLDFLPTGHPPHRRPRAAPTLRWTCPARPT
jgi:hypothetical protein